MRKTKLSILANQGHHQNHPEDDGRQKNIEQMIPFKFDEVESNGCLKHDEVALLKKEIKYLRNKIEKRGGREAIENPNHLSGQPRNKNV